VRSYKGGGGGRKEKMIECAPREGREEGRASQSGKSAFIAWVQKREELAAAGDDSEGKKGTAPRKGKKEEGKNRPLFAGTLEKEKRKKGEEKAPSPSVKGRGEGEKKERTALVPFFGIRVLGGEREERLPPYSGRKGGKGGALSLISIR